MQAHAELVDGRSLKDMFVNREMLAAITSVEEAR